MAGIVFALVSNRAKFYISAFCGLTGVLITYVFVPDISALDLREGAHRLLLFHGRMHALTGVRASPAFPLWLTYPALDARERACTGPSLADACASETVVGAGGSARFESINFSDAGQF